MCRLFPFQQGDRVPIRRLMTLHAPLGRLLSNPVLETLDRSLRTHGITKWWISPKYLPDAVILAEVPERVEQEIEGDDLPS